MEAPTSAAAAWAASGALWLTGRAEAPPLVAPDGVVARMEALGCFLEVDTLGLLTERAGWLALSRRGETSCGGGTRLIRAADGWLAVGLPRPDDIAAAPAWLEVDVPEADPWPVLRDTIAQRPVRELAERAAMFGLPVAAAGEATDPPCAFHELPVHATRMADAAPLERPPVVVDLSSLWAGPLCTRLLVDRGAYVIKVESVRRPDGARRGPSGFFDSLHAGKMSVALDLSTRRGADALAALLGRADVVVEASRARALSALGIDAADVIARGGPRVWLSITGYGRDSNRVAFGDDAAVAGGLVACDGEGPCFAADAVADPLTGVAAAAAVVAALGDGGRWMIDAAMAGVAAHVAGDDRCARWTSDDRLVAARPLRRMPAGARGPALGADHDEVARRLGIDLS